MSCRHRRAIQNFVVYHLIFFFILTPFLASCGGGGSSSDNNTPTALTEEEIIANAVEDQNRSAMTAITQTVEMLQAIDNARNLIEDTFGTSNPTTADIEAFVRNNNEAATSLLAQLNTELENVGQAADSLVTSAEEMEEMEETINSAFGGTGTLASEAHRRTLALGVDDYLILLGLAGLLAAMGKAVSDQVHRVGEDDDDSDDDDEDPSGDYDIYSKVSDLVDSVNNWDDIAAEAVKAGATTAVTTVGSAGAEEGGYKTVKFGFDAYGAYDSGQSIKGVTGIRSCEVGGSTQSQSLPDSVRKSTAVEYEDLAAEDIYVATPDEDGTFHNVPPGNWTFVVFIDGHLRTVTGCINTGEDEADTIIEVEVEPVPIDEIDELLENTPDEIVACSDLSDCEDGYICYLGFCEPESDFPMGSSSYVGHWRIIAENTTSNYWVADTLMMDTGRFNLQIYLWGTELGSVQRGIWSYNTRYNTLTLVDDYGSEIISGPINWENQNTDFWQTGTWAGSTEQKRYAWLKQEDEDDDCPCDGPTCPTRCPD